jgi:hypothetical protein
MSRIGQDWPERAGSSKIAGPQVKLAYIVPGDKRPCHMPGPDHVQARQLASRHRASPTIVKGCQAVRVDLGANQVGNWPPSGVN